MMSEYNSYFELVRNKAYTLSDLEKINLSYTHDMINEATSEEECAVFKLNGKDIWYLFDKNNTEEFRFLERYDLYGELGPNITTTKSRVPIVSILTSKF